MDSNTIFITGGGTGIGKGLAEAFHRLGNQVIISGRREDKLKAVCAANSGMRYRVLDVTDPAEVARVGAEVVREFPALNCVINNAGVQKYLDLTGNGGQPIDQDIEEEIAINLLGAIRVLRAYLPQLKRVKGTLINVTSGLAYVPRFHTPVYCATKAAMHSLTMSLRVQLADAGVKVIELIPPRVDTELGGAAPTPYTLPVNTFVDEAMKGLAADADEVAVGMAKDLMALAGAEAVKQRMMSFGR